MIIRVEFNANNGGQPSLYKMKFEDDEPISQCLNRIATKARIKFTQEELQTKYALLLTQGGKYQYLPQDKVLSDYITVPEDVLLRFVIISNRIIVMGLENETKQITVDFCQENQLEVILEQLANSYHMKAKDVYLTLPTQPDKEINVQKCLFELGIVHDELFVLKTRKRKKKSNSLIAKKNLLRNKLHNSNMGLRISKSPSDIFPPMLVPSLTLSPLLFDCIYYIQYEAINTPCLFQLPGGAAGVEQTRKLHENFGSFNTKKIDPFVVCDLFKSCLKEYSVLLPFVHKEITPESLQITGLDAPPAFNLLNELSTENLILIKYLFTFFHRVASCSASNRMKATELATIFTPLVSFSDSENAEKVFVEFVELLIKYPEWIPKKIPSPHFDFETSFTIPKLLPSEIVLHIFHDSAIIVGENQLNSITFLSNFQLLFVYSIEEKSLSQVKLSIPLFSLLSVEKRGEKDSAHLHILSKDFKSIDVFFRTLNDLGKAHDFLSHYVPYQHLSVAFAFHSALFDRSQDLKYEIDYIGEFRRQGMPIPQEWRYYALSQAKAYPRQILIPSSLQENIILSISSIYCNDCIPTIIWKSPSKRFLLKSSIPRKEASSPVTSLRDSRLKSESKLSPKIGDPDKHAYFGAITADSENKNIQVITCVGQNELRSGKQNLKLLNFHHIDELFANLRDGISSGAGSIKFGEAVKNWVSNVGEMIMSAHSLSSLLRNDHLLIEDNGFANYSLLSLIMIMNDPFYRTIDGFTVVIEHVWIRFGYPFADALLIGKTSTGNTKIGYFVQFIDCVWQLLSLIPSIFEFNEYYLITILDTMFHGRYGTFLGNSEREMEYLCYITFNAFTSLLKTPNAKFLNPFYSSDLNSTSNLTVDFQVTTKKIVFWRDYYLKWSTKDTYFKCRKTIKDSMSAQEPQLNLSHRKITSLPRIISQCSFLQSLILSHCRIASFPIIVATLPSLTSIDLSYNSIRYISESMIDIITTNLTQLTTLDLSYNDLYSINKSITKLTSLKTLNLQNSKFSKPHFHQSFFNFERLESLNMNSLQVEFNFSVLQGNIKYLSLSNTKITKFGAQNVFPHLETLILQENDITHFAEFGEFPSLTYLDLSSNYLTEISDDLCKLVTLQELYLSNNEIQFISPKILHIPLRVLEIQQNNFPILPPFFSKFHSLQTFKFTSQFLIVPPPEIACKSFEVIKKYLSDRLNHIVPSFRCSIMFVGQENVGKSSLKRALISKSYDKINISTDGILIEEWKFPLEVNNITETITASVYDFAGQSIYYSSHQFFLEKDAIFILTWNILDRVEDSKIEYWLETIKSKGNSPVILVATHLDHDKCTKDYVTKSLQKLANDLTPRYPSIVKITAVSCNTGRGVEDLFKIITSVLLSSTHIVQDIPIKWSYLENHILSYRKKLNPPLMSFNEFSEICSIFCIEGEEDMITAAKTLHSWGTIFYQAEEHLSDLVIIDPAWLTKLMATILTTKHTYIKNGVINNRDFIHIWHPNEYALSFHSSMYQLLVRFEMIYPLDKSWEEGKSLVPSLLPTQKPDAVNELFPRFDSIPQFLRIYQFNFVPTGFINHLFIRFMQLTTLEIAWRHGVLAHQEYKSNLNYVLLELLPTSNEIYLTVRGNTSAKLFLDCIHIIDAFTENWYKLDKLIQIPCPHCINNRLLTPHLFTLKQCKEAILSRSPFIKCQSGNSIRLREIVPDLSMDGVPRIEYSQIVQEKIIGEGAFSTVYKATYENMNVALKMIKIDLNHLPKLEATYSEFVRECWTLSSLQHQNVLRFIGLCVDPLCIVTDFANQGSLYDFLHSETTHDLASSYPLKYKIAYDIANGMNFLHNRSPPIIHADLKSPNILLKSITPTDQVVAVVADFGLSKSWVPVLQGREVDNPIWLAPEILAGKNYSEKADVYSFGVILFEIVTLRHFLGNYRFMYKLEDDIMNGVRPDLPPSTDENNTLLQLIQECWQNDPSKRPTFTSILSRIQHSILKLGIDSVINVVQDNTTADHLPLSSSPSDATPRTVIHSPDDSSKLISSLYPQHDSGIVSMIHTSTNDIWTASANGSITIINASDNFSREKVLPAHACSISAMLQVSEQHVWTSSIGEKAIKVWNVNTAKFVHSIPTRGIEIISFIQIQNEVWAGTTEGCIFTWDRSFTPGSSFFSMKQPSLSDNLPLFKIVDKLLDATIGIDHTRKVIGDNFILPHCFSGSELINWISSHFEMNSDRVAAVEIAKSLLKAGIITHIFHSSQFEISQNESSSPRDYYRVVPSAYMLIHPSGSSPSLPPHNNSNFDIQFINDDNVAIGFYFLPLSRSTNITNLSCFVFDVELNLLWIGHNIGLDVFDLDHGLITAKYYNNHHVKTMLQVRHCIWVSSDNSIYVFHRKTMELVHKIVVGTTVTSMTLNENFVWVASSDRSLSIWCATTYSILLSFSNHHSDYISSLILLQNIDHSKHDFLNVFNNEINHHRNNKNDNCNDDDDETISERKKKQIIPKSVILTSSLDRSVLIWDTTINEDDLSESLNTNTEFTTRVRKMTETSNDTSLLSPDLLEAISNFKDTKNNLITMVADNVHLKLESCICGPPSVKFPDDEPRLAIYSMFTTSPSKLDTSVFVFSVGQNANIEERARYSQLCGLTHKVIERLWGNKPHLVVVDNGILDPDTIFVNFLSSHFTSNIIEIGDE